MGGDGITWHYPEQTSFAWQTFATTFTVAPGEHILYVKHREDGTELSAVRIVAGEAGFEECVYHPDSTEATALQGFLNGAFVVDSDGAETYAVVPNDAGVASVVDGTVMEHYVSFPFTNCETTTVQFAVRARAPTGSDDSFHMQVDGRDGITWHYPQQTSFAWQTFSTTYTIAPGTHTLYVKHREDGTDLSAVQIVAGAAG